MIAEYLTAGGEWVRDVCTHPGNPTLTAVHEVDLFGSETVREVGYCDRCGQWFSLANREVGLFDEVTI